MNVDPCKKHEPTTKYNTKTRAGKVEGEEGSGKE